MIGVDEALAYILDSIQPLPAVERPLLDALGLTLVEAVVATEPVPRFSNSAMDGYAVRAADVQTAAHHQPVDLRVVADVAAGHPSAVALAAGEAARIMTGAPVPAGADAVVRFEATDEGAAGASPDRRRVQIYAPVARGDNVRLLGEDIQAGAVVLPAGARLRPAEIGVLASLGIARVHVHRRPRVAILATGDEVVPLHATPGPGQIRDSNSATLAALVRDSGGEPVLLGIARDRLADVGERLAAGQTADVVISSAGVSVGDFDVVKQALQSLGTIQLWQVNMKPGKPLAFGQLGVVPFLGLPGNPVAAVVSFELFGRPLLGRLLGRREPPHRIVPAVTLEPLENGSARRHFVRVTVGPGVDGCLQARPVGNQGSGVLTSLVQANGLAIVPEGVTQLPAGEHVEVMVLDWD